MTLKATKEVARRPLRAREPCGRESDHVEEISRLRGDYDGELRGEKVRIDILIQMGTQIQLMYIIVLLLRRSPLSVKYLARDGYLRADRYIL